MVANDLDHLNSSLQRTINIESLTVKSLFLVKIFPPPTFFVFYSSVIEIITCPLLFYRDEGEQGRSAAGWEGGEDWIFCLKMLGNFWSKFMMF